MNNSVRNDEIRFTRDTGAEEITTTIQVHPVLIEGGNVRAAEIMIEQLIYKKFNKKHSPRRLYGFVLTEENRLALIAMLEDCA